MLKFLRSRLSQEQVVLLTSLKTACSQILPGGIIADSLFFTGVAQSAYGDPDFSWCGGGDGRCRTALGQNVNGGSNLFLYNTAAWAFFDGPWTGDYGTQCSGNCQVNMNRVSGTPSKLYWYGIGTKSADIMVFDGQSNPATFNNPGGWGGNMVGYRQFS